MYQLAHWGSKGHLEYGDSGLVRKQASEVQ